MAATEAGPRRSSPSAPPRRNAGEPSCVVAVHADADDTSATQLDLGDVSSCATELHAFYLTNRDACARSVALQASPSLAPHAVFQLENANLGALPEDQNQLFHEVGLVSRVRVPPAECQRVVLQLRPHKLAPPAAPDEAEAAAASSSLSSSADASALSPSRRHAFRAIRGAITASVEDGTTAAAAAAHLPVVGRECDSEIALSAATLTLEAPRTADGTLALVKDISVRNLAEIGTAFKVRIRPKDGGLTCSDYESGAPLGHAERLAGLRQRALRLQFSALEPGEYEYALECVNARHLANRPRIAIRVLAAVAQQEEILRVQCGAAGCERGDNAEVLHFGDVYLGSTVRRDILLKNTSGEERVEVSLAPASAKQLAMAPVRLSPGEQCSASVAYSTLPPPGGEPSTRDGRLADQRFELVLQYCSTSSTQPKQAQEQDEPRPQQPQQRKRRQSRGTRSKRIACRARTCESIVHVHPTDVNLGDCYLESPYSTYVQLVNTSALPAVIGVRLSSASVTVPSNELIIGARQSYDLRIDFTPHRVIPDYAKQLTLVNRNNSDNENVVVVRANCVDRFRVLYHALFYKLTMQSQQANELHYGAVVAGHTYVRSFRVKNVTDKPLTLGFEVPKKMVQLLAQRGADRPQQPRARRAEHGVTFANRLRHAWDVAAGGTTGREDDARAASERVPALSSSLSSSSDAEYAVGAGGETSTQWQAHARQPQEPASAAGRTEAKGEEEAAEEKQEEKNDEEEEKEHLRETKRGERGDVENEEGEHGEQDGQLDLAVLSQPPPASPTFFAGAEAEAEYIEAAMRQARTLARARAQGLLQEVERVAVEAGGEVVIYAALRVDPERRRLRTKLRPFEEKIFISLLDYDAERLPEVDEQFTLPPRELLAVGRACLSRMELAQSHINFGRIVAGEQRAKTMLVQNLSEVHLLYMIRKTGSVASGYLHFGSDRAGVLRPFSAKEVPFVFRPSLHGAFEEPVRVENMLDASECHAVAMKATVHKPTNFAVQPSALDFGAVEADAQSQPAVFCVENRSERRREFSVEADADELRGAAQLRIEVAIEAAKERKERQLSAEAGGGGGGGGDGGDDADVLEQKLKIAERKGKAEKAARLREQIARLRGHENGGKAEANGDGGGGGGRGGGIGGAGEATTVADDGDSERARGDGVSKEGGSRGVDTSGGASAAAGAAGGSDDRDQKSGRGAATSSAPPSLPSHESQSGRISFALQPGDEARVSLLLKPRASARDGCTLPVYVFETRNRDVQRCVECTYRVTAPSLLRRAMAVLGSRATAGDVGGGSDDGEGARGRDAAAAGSWPLLQLSSAWIDFGQVMVGLPAEQRVVLQNASDRRVQFTVLEDSTAVLSATVIWSPTKGSVAPRDAAPINVVFRPEGLGRVSRTLSVRAMAPESGGGGAGAHCRGAAPSPAPIRLRVTGVGVARPSIRVLNVEPGGVWEFGDIYIDPANPLANARCLRLASVSAAPLVLTFRSNLSKQVHFFAEQSCDTPVERLRLEAGAEAHVYVCLAPRFSERELWAGKARTIVGGVQVLVSEPRGAGGTAAADSSPSRAVGGDSTAAVEEVTVKFRARAGFAEAELLAPAQQPRLFGVAGVVRVRNRSEALPVAVRLRVVREGHRIAVAGEAENDNGYDDGRGDDARSSETDAVTVQPTEAVLAPRDAVEVRYAWRVRAPGLHTARMLLVNESYASREFDRHVQLVAFVDPGVVRLRALEDCTRVCCVREDDARPMRGDGDEATATAMKEEDHSAVRMSQPGHVAVELAPVRATHQALVQRLEPRASEPFVQLEDGCVTRFRTVCPTGGFDARQMAALRRGELIARDALIMYARARSVSGPDKRPDETERVVACAPVSVPFGIALAQVLDAVVDVGVVGHRNSNASVPFGVRLRNAGATPVRVCVRAPELPPGVLLADRRDACEVQLGRCGCDAEADTAAVQFVLEPTIAAERGAIAAGAFELAVPLHNVLNERQPLSFVVRGELTMPLLSIKGGNRVELDEDIVLPVARRARGTLSVRARDVSTATARATTCAAETASTATVGPPPATMTTSSSSSSSSAAAAAAAAGGSDNDVRMEWRANILRTDVLARVELQDKSSGAAMRSVTLNSGERLDMRVACVVREDVPQSAVENEAGAERENGALELIAVVELLATRKRGGVGDGSDGAAEPAERVPIWGRVRRGPSVRCEPGRLVIDDEAPHELTLRNLWLRDAVDISGELLMRDGSACEADGEVTLSAQPPQVHLEPGGSAVMAVRALRASDGGRRRRRIGLRTGDEAELVLSDGTRVPVQLLLSASDGDAALASAASRSPSSSGRERGEKANGGRGDGGSSDDEAESGTERMGTPERAERADEDGKAEEARQPPVAADQADRAAVAEPYDGPTFRLRGCAADAVSEQYEIDAGQVTVGSEPVEWRVSVESLHPSAAIEYKVSRTAGAVRAGSASWLTLDRSGGVVERARGAQQLTFRLLPARMGVHQDYVLLEDRNSPADLVSVRVAMEVVADRADAARSFTVLPDSIDYGTVMLGHVYKHRSVVVRNHTQAPLEFLLRHDMPGDARSELNFSASNMALRKVSSLWVPPAGARRVYLYYRPERERDEEGQWPRGELEAADGTDACGTGGDGGSGAHAAAAGATCARGPAAQAPVERSFNVLVSCRLVRDHQTRIRVRSSCLPPRITVSTTDVSFTLGDDGALSPSDESLVAVCGARDAEAARADEQRGASSSSSYGQRRSCRMRDDVQYTVRSDAIFFDVTSAPVDAATRSSDREQEECGALLGRIRIRPRLDAVRELAPAEKYIEEHCTVYNRARPKEFFWVRLRLKFGSDAAQEFSAAPLRRVHVLEALIARFLRQFARFWAPLRRQRVPGAGADSMMLAVSAGGSAAEELLGKIREKQRAALERDPLRGWMERVRAATATSPALSMRTTAERGSEVALRSVETARDDAHAPSLYEALLFEAHYCTDELVFFALRDPSGAVLRLADLCYTFIFKADVFTVYAHNGQGERGDSDVRGGAFGGENGQAVAGGDSVGAALEPVVRPWIGQLRHFLSFFPNEATEELRALRDTLDRLCAVAGRRQEQRPRPRRDA